MPSAQATIAVEVSAETVFAYLESRYDSEVHRSASLAAKGYVPAVVCLEAVPNKWLLFEVPVRDPLGRSLTNGWSWSYDIEPDGGSASRVTITYRWSWWLSLLGAGTTHHQACNEITETAMALDALAFRPRERDTADRSRSSSPQITELRSEKPPATGIQEQSTPARRSPDADSGAPSSMPW